MFYHLNSTKTEFSEGENYYVSAKVMQGLDTNEKQEALLSPVVLPSPLAVL